MPEHYSLSSGHGGVRLDIRGKGQALLLLAVSVTRLLAEDPSGAPASAGRPQLLDAAFQAFLAEQGRWAYTETHGESAAAAPRTVLQVDPSQPYGEQFHPVLLGGRKPTEKERKAWAKRGEERGLRMQRREVQGKSAQDGEAEFRLRINGREVIPDLDHAVLVTEDETSATYEVPMRHKPNGPLFDEVQVTARVRKARPAFERVTIRQLAAMRAGAGKFEDGLTEIEFGTPDAQFPSVPVKIAWQTTQKALFGQKRELKNVAVRTELKRVTPYDERFGVELGPLRVIEF